jgi:hypothetical protein
VYLRTCSHNACVCMYVCLCLYASIRVCVCVDARAHVLLPVLVGMPINGHLAAFYALAATAEGLETQGHPQAALDAYERAISAMLARIRRTYSHDVLREGRPRVVEWEREKVCLCACV